MFTWNVLRPALPKPAGSVINEILEKPKMLTTLGFIWDKIYYATVRSKILLMRLVKNNMVVTKRLKVDTKLVLAAW
jgi:hypothetical protein